tara:strand:+ start:114 stop:566 length:453 start_codon:yes stop_codon:yes gene_type:complete
MLVSVFLFGCSKSDLDIVPDNSTLILGVWEVENSNFNYVIKYLDPIYGTEVEVQNYSETSTVDGGYIVFRYDSTFSIYQYTNDSLTDSYTLFYEIDENNIKDDDIILFTIQTLTDNTLSITNTLLEIWEGDTTYIEERIYTYNCIKSELP